MVCTFISFVAGLCEVYNVAVWSSILISCLTAELKMYDRVSRTDEPVGFVIVMFKSAKYGGWTANVCWEETNWREDEPMSALVHAEN
jgi:hypothetical protein